MVYEKKYKDILSLAKSYKGNNLKEFLDLVFPELNENEDERIRKELIKFLKFLSEGIAENYTPVSLKDFVAYLEKQKGKMTAEEFESSEPFQLKLKTKYANGYQDGLVQKEQKPAPTWMLKFLDELRTKSLPGWEDYDLHKEMEGRILAIIRWLSPDYFTEKKKEQNPAEWSEEDEKIMQTMIKEGDLKPSEIAWLKDLYLRLQPKAEWSERDKRMMNELIIMMEGGKVTSGTYLIEYAAWLKDLRNHIVSQPKQEWSEQDEEHINSIFSDFKQGVIPDEEDQEWLKNHLKSLRPQPKLNEDEIKKIRSEEYTKGFNDAAFGYKQEWSEEDSRT